MPGLLEPLLDTMSGAARVAWPHIEAGIARGLSANSIQTLLTDAGIGIRRTDLLALAREARNAVLVKSDLERLPRNILVPPERVRQAVTKIVGPVSYTLTATAVDALTGEERPVTLTAHSSELRPFDQVEADFLEANAEDYPLPGFTLVDARVVDVVRSGVAGVI